MHFSIYIGIFVNRPSDTKPGIQYVV